MDISFIIVNWNTKDLLDQAITSIYKYAKGFTCEVIVVDNNSSDESVGMVKKKHPKVRLIINKENFGFAKANNQGIEVAKGNFIFLFNSDAYLINDSIQKLLARAGEISNLGAIAPQVLNEDRSIQQSAGFFPNLPQIFWWMTFLDDLPFGTIFKPYHIDHDRFYKTEHQADWTTGAAFMISKKVIEKVGPMDDKIFMYGEEVEWCYRIKKAGFKIYFSPVSSMIHIGRGSSGKIPKNAILGEYKGLVYLYKKHKGFLSLQLLRILLKMGGLLRVIVFGALGKKELAKTYVEAIKVA